MTKSVRKGVFYALTVTFLIVALIYSVVRFAPVFLRTLQAFVDFGTSIAYYGCFVVNKEYLISPTIGDLPATLETLLPLTIEEFERFIEIFFELLVDQEHLLRYLDVVCDVLNVTSKTILMLLLPALAFLLILILIYKDTDNDYNQDSSFLKFFKKIYRRTWRVVKFYVVKYLRFLKTHKWWRRALIVVWLYNLNLFTIAIELVSWYFYFCVTFDLEATLVVVAKVIVDLSVSLFFLPVWVQAIIGFKIFDWWRKRVAFGRIRAAIKKIKKFLEEHPGAKFINGRQRSKKTSLVTQFKIVLENYIFRPKAEEKFLTRAKQFPQFPWIIYDRFIMNARARHRLYTWTGIRSFFKFLKWADASSKTWTDAQRANVMRHLRRRWGYDFEDFCFGYTGERIFDDGLQLVSIYDALESYGKTFMLYTQPTPLDVANYSIRSDYVIVDEGNLPAFHGDTIEWTTKESMQASQYGHRINWDAFRLGKQFNPNNPENDSIEYGIRCSMEHGKERKNQLTKRAADKEEGFPNQDNDLVETETKVHTHIATCDNFTFWDDLLDEQRSSSLGAENRDLTTMLYIKHSGSARFYLPFFVLDDTIFQIVTAIFDKIYKFVRHKKGSNTALIALLWKLYVPFFRYYTRNYNRFSYYPLEIIPTDGGTEESATAEKIPLIAILAYRYRFTTDALGEFYYMKLKGAQMGLNDIPQYKAHRMSITEMDEQNSYMIKDMARNFRGIMKSSGKSAGYRTAECNEDKAA